MRSIQIVLSQHHTHAQDDPDRAALSTPPLTVHTGNLRQSGEVHGRFCVARIGRSMPDYPWHRTSTYAIGQPPDWRARDHAPRNPEASYRETGSTYWMSVIVGRTVG